MNLSMLEILVKSNILIGAKFFILYGYQRVKLIIQSSNGFNIINLPLLNNFKMVLFGDSPSNSNIDLLLESVQSTTEEIQEDLKKQLANLKLYVNLYSDNMVSVIPHNSPKVGFEDKKRFEETTLNSLEELTEAKLPKYLSNRTSQQQLLLQKALDELKIDDLFNAFPKLINWLDENDHKGASRFCSIRDSCDHGALDKHRAIKKVNEGFPGEFEFEDDVLKRNSEKNEKSMKKHLPEVLDHIKQVFKEKFVE